ncbi:NAD(P)/FAD-dependent oxidoreductase [Flavobacterium sp. DSR2-3-3]|uniref:NAD(P)/FAD-dependent oxidoreductase n=1 Tax=Flavobacterium sp. DSR2-3-3 TaxID=2804632 RepID=UPI003CEB19EE
MYKKFHIKHSYSGIFSEQGGSIGAFQLAHDILAYNHEKGLKIFDKTDIKIVTYKQNGVSVLTEHGTTITGKKIIYCNGFESTEIIKNKFVKLLFTYAIVGERFEDEQSHLNGTLFWNTAEPYMYMRTTDDNRLLIGGEDEDFVNAEKRDSLLNDKSVKLTKYLKKILPDYNFRMDFVWAGTVGETKYGLPYICKHPNFKSAYFVLGFGGNGITFSVTRMELVSKMLKNKKHPLAEYFKFRM